MDITQDVKSMSIVAESVVWLATLQKVTGCWLVDYEDDIADPSRTDIWYCVYIKGTYCNIVTNKELFYRAEAHQIADANSNYHDLLYIVSGGEIDKVIIKVVLDLIAEFDAKMEG